MHAFDLIIYGLAAAVTVAAYLRDPGLPAVGLRAGGQLLLDVLPRLVAALVMTGMIQVMISPEWIQHWLGRGSTHRGDLRRLRGGHPDAGRAARELPDHGGLLQGRRVPLGPGRYMTSWSLFGFQRVLAWELPFMGTRFLLARVLPTLVFPIVAGYLVRFIYHD